MSGLKGGHSDSDKQSNLVPLFKDKGENPIDTFHDLHEPCGLS